MRNLALINIYSICSLFDVVNCFESTLYLSVFRGRKLPLLSHTCNP